MNSDNKYYLWTPLVGFDMEKQDRGVDEYFSKIKSKPKGISLFVFNADIIYMHKGMDEEFTFRPDFCNYYGAQRNEIRSIQPWTNYKFRELVGNIKKKAWKLTLVLWVCTPCREIEFTSQAILVILQTKTI